MQCLELLTSLSSSCAQGKLADMYATTQVQLHGRSPWLSVSVEGLLFASRDDNHTVMFSFIDSMSARATVLISAVYYTGMPRVCLPDSGGR